MSNELPMPTRGRVECGKLTTTSCGDIISVRGRWLQIARSGNRYAAGFMFCAVAGGREDQHEANVTLCAAAFNAATAAADLGFDPIAAVEALPELLKALNDIAAWSDGPEVGAWFDNPGDAELARTALAAARTRGITA
jgi:hypothetical protein